MPIIQYDESHIITSLKALPPPLRVAFALLCSERVLPGYVAYYNRTGKGNPRTIVAIMDRIWQDIGGNIMSEEELQSSLDLVMSLVPEEEQGAWVHERAYAEDAAVAVAYAVRCRKRNEPQEAAWAARRAYEALDAFIINHYEVSLELPGYEDRIISHPVIQAELHRQHQDLEDLLIAASTSDPSVTLATLRDRARKDANHFFDSDSST